MVHAVIHNGQLEVQEPILDTWEGQLVKITPLTPDDPLPDLERRLAELHALGPIEIDADERDRTASELHGLNKMSIAAMGRWTDPTG